MSNLWQSKIVRSRKQHQCDLCRCMIPKGELYTRIFWVCDSDAGTHKLHNECDEFYHKYCLEWDAFDDNPPPEYPCVKDCMWELDKKVEWQSHIDMMAAKYGGQS